MAALTTPIPKVLPRANDEDDVEAEPEIEVGLFDEAGQQEDKNPQGAITLYKQIISKEDTKGELLRLKEDSVSRLAKLYARLKQNADVRGLLSHLRPWFLQLPGAKANKIMNSIIDAISDDELQLQSELINDAIEICQQQKRSFNKQRMQSRLANLFFKMKKYKEALSLIARVVREVKKVDDKKLLLELQLVESRVHHQLQNIPKSKAALTSARTAANAIYCPPLLQAQIDLQAGIIACEEKDFKTGFSYFYEAFEGYHTLKSQTEANSCLKYMLLAKIMTNQPEDVFAIIAGKAGREHPGREVDAMREVATAYKQRSIHEFDRVFAKYTAELGDDAIISAHLDSLKANLLEQNLIRLIEPFSRVQIGHVAKLIDLPREFVEAKLSEMILDKKLPGILDQGSGDLIVFDETTSDKTYTASLDTMKELSNVVDRLYGKAKKLTR